MFKEAGCAGNEQRVEEMEAKEEGDKREDGGTNSVRNFLPVVMLRLNFPSCPSKIIIIIITIIAKSREAMKKQVSRKRDMSNFG